MKFNGGEIVRWTEAMAQSAEERDMLFVVREPGDDGRCYITLINGDYAIAPTQMVKQEWMELA